MKALLLYNPLSGKGRIVRRLKEIIKIFSQAGYDIIDRDIDFNRNPFEGYEDVNLVVICGGDGTVNYVVDKMYQKGISPEIGIIPAGTANDFAGALGMKRNIVNAARQIANGSIRHVDCGLVNGRCFVNVLSFGVLTTTSQQTSDKEKQIVGKLAYLRTGAIDLLKMHKIPVTVKYDGNELKVNAAMLLVFNGCSAGQFKLAPYAKIDDGKLDILILDYNNAAKTCLNMLQYLLSHESGAVHYIRSNDIDIYSDIDEPTDIDGQPGPHIPLRIECMKGSLKIRA